MFFINLEVVNKIKKVLKGVYIKLDDIRFLGSILKVAGPKLKSID